jgi:aryl-alcohol dehydrogenase-like predicted oxidoreductase
MSKKKKEISRRTFIKHTAAGAMALSAGGLITSCLSPKKLPVRPLGRTGINISMISFGGGSQFMLNKNGQWEPLLERAVEAGMNFFDTAPSYNYRNKQTSEERYGEILSKYRSKVYISTKFDKPQVDTALKEFEQSLKRLKTDYVDFLLLHAIGDSMTLEDIEREKTYEAIAKLKEQGVVKHIGFSSMNHAPDCEEILNRYDFDMALLSYNPVGVTKRVYGDKVIPLAHKKGVGVITMKVMRVLAQESGNMDMENKKNFVMPSAKELLQYNLTNEFVDSALIGYKTIDIMEDNIRLAHEIANGDLLKLDRKELEKRVAHLETPQYLPYLDPNYVDGDFV